mgnify:CR=1 FL=1
MQQTLYAMKRVEEIRAVRQERFKLARKVLANKKQRSDALREIKRGIDLIISPIARKQQGIDINETLKMRKTVQSSQMDE